MVIYTLKTATKFVTGTFKTTKFVTTALHYNTTIKRSAPPPSLCFRLKVSIVIYGLCYVNPLASRPNERPTKSTNSATQKVATQKVATQKVATQVFYTYAIFMPFRLGTILAGGFGTFRFSVRYTFIYP